uniref:Uncharacterized protein n=1 Tax=Glossina brevipalpis TaxID=37001 RepID=A0A1A9WBK1_9MUSC
MTEFKDNINCVVNNKRKKFSRVYPETDGDDIVITGIAGKFPNCRNVAELEYKLYNKVDMVDDDERRWRHVDHEVPKRSGKIYDLEKFDATFFGVHFKQSHTMDPQTRILIEIAYEAVIDAGINPKSLRGSRTGVYIGCCISESEKTWFYEKASPGGFGLTGCSRAMLPNRISYSMGLEGPSYLIDTACSSSMYALDNAFTAFRNGEIDAAIIGGANLCLHPQVTLQFARLGVLAKDGYCRPFDQNGVGYTRSEAISCLFLQRKRDAKRVYASIVYSKTNCDGYKPEGITYPSGKLQEKLLSQFYQEIDVRPEDLGYLEAHSTGTKAGDPEECRAIDNVICSQRSKPLLVGSIKSNLGHTEAAAGVCSLAKVCLALERRKIAPNINLTKLRSEISALTEERLIVVKDIMNLEKPYIGVNSFGFGGANAHVLLKAFDRTKINNGVPDDDIPRLITWAGRTEESVNVIFDSIEGKPLDAEFISLLQNIQNEDVTGLVFRGYGIFAKNGNTSAKSLVRDVDHYSGITRPIVWVFSGMGSQWTEMGSSLMIIPQFRQSIQHCQKALKSKDLNLNLMEILTSSDATIFDNILHSFVGIAAIQIALVDLLRSLNMQPDYIIGHSVGELGCGYADGGFTAEQMILASYYRGKVSLEIEKIKGSMAAIGVGYKKIVNFLPKKIEVACHNSADSCTISGPAEDVERFVNELKSKGIFAKEVPCSNIAYHSRYIAHMGPQLLKYLKKIIPNPKPRSSKWLSSSVPQADWHQEGRNLCSAEYHANNLLNSVLFEETSALLPNNALTIEIAPHGLLQAILKRSMPNGIHIPLTQRDNKGNDVFLLSAIGKLFINGVTFPTANLYPKIEFPVSRGTPGISSLIRFDHSEDWFVSKYEDMKTKSKAECSYTVNLDADVEGYFTGHIIDGKVLVPAICYLRYVWEAFSRIYHGPNYMIVPVEFENVKFIRATTLIPNNSIELNVVIQYGTGYFEITESGALVITGSIREIEQPSPPKVYEFIEESHFPKLCQKDFYKELKLRGYHYSGGFQAIREARGDGLYGKIGWNYNWVTFMDAMLQIQILGTDSRTLLLPTKIEKLRIYGLHHMDLLTRMDKENPLFEVYVDRKYDRIVSGGIEIVGLRASPVQRRKPPGIPVLERYQFVSHFPAPAFSIHDTIRICVQLALENSTVTKIKAVEVDTDGRYPIIESFVEAIEDLPVVTGDYLFLSNKVREDISKAVHVENGKLFTQKNCHFIIIGGLEGELNEISVAQAPKCLVERGYLVVRNNNSPGSSDLKIPPYFKMIAELPVEETAEIILLFQYMGTKKHSLESTVVEISDCDKEFKWIAQVQESVNNKTPTIVYAYNEKLNGLIGLVNCLRKEPDGHLITCFFINDERAPAFNINEPLYATQYALGLAVNVYQNGKWGSYRHLQLNPDIGVVPRNDHVYGNVSQRGDLSSLHWFEGPLKPEDCDIKIVYSSVNFRDIMLATGRLAVELFGDSRLDQSCVLGLEYSGIDMKTGRRVMSMAAKGGVGSYVKKPSTLAWNVPENWSLKDAATVPVVYITVYYAFFIVSDIRKGKSILIHAGTGGIGLAAIRVALAYNLEVFTTCSTPQKKQFLLDTFPQLKETHIGNSRDTSFLHMIRRETNGKGVDFVLNSLSEDKLLASVRCLGFRGNFLEIGKFDMANDTKLGMSCFLKEIKFNAVLADRLLFAPDEEIAHLKALIDHDISNGIIQPLPATVFQAHEIEQAFRHMVGGKHLGKVVIQVRENPESELTMPVKVVKQVYFNANLSYVIPGGLGGFGLELADWMAVRGAKKIVLSSSRGLTNDYQRYRIALWKTYGCEVLISTSNICTYEGCYNLLKEAKNLAPIGGIFNLAVILQDAIFLNQTKEKFVKCFNPKAVATKYLDEVSRVMCPKLEYFVVFSSVSCGRGNAGQTNYGMANSVMERIIEDRLRNGFPAKAIQWGAVGEVGLVADMVADKLDLDIGGTLQQRISSCLQELDALLKAPDAIVGSMVVAEKRLGKSGSENITQSIMNIMGIRDTKSISLGTTLSEMGMDSLMAVEIQQTLERNFDLALTQQDLRALTLQKLQEYEDERKREDTEATKETSEESPQGIALLLRNLGDESRCNEVIIELQSDQDTSKLPALPTIIIPGIEGTAGQVWYNMAQHVKSKVNLLQFHRFAELTTIKEIAEACLEDVKAVLKGNRQFYIVAYSYGACIALELVRMLEKAGFHGQLLLIDGAPHFLSKLIRLQMCGHVTDNNIYDLLLSTIVQIIFPEDIMELHQEQFDQLPTIEQKMNKFDEYIAKQSVYSPEYCKTMIHALFRRISSVVNCDLENFEPINTPITLIRSTKVALHETDENYCLEEITKGTIVMKVIEGNHTSMLDNPILPQLINDFNPLLTDSKDLKQ